MGSAGRFEQSVWSDQDHGIIYQRARHRNKRLFFALGKEISKGLYLAGYEYCDGDVMASNPFWCKSLSEWQEQLSTGPLDSNWESIRNLLIFIDGRSLYGDSKLSRKLKELKYIKLFKMKIFLQKYLTIHCTQKRNWRTRSDISGNTRPHTGSSKYKRKSPFSICKCGSFIGYKREYTRNLYSIKT